MPKNDEINNQNPLLELLVIYVLPSAFNNLPLPRTIVFI